MDDASGDFDAVWDALSQPRLAPYLRVACDQRHALALYEWNARTAAAAFEIVGHLEVLVRNAMDTCLREYFRDAERGIPWFMLPSPGGDHIPETVTAVRQRLRQQHEPRADNVSVPSLQDSRDQIVAHLTFGFWSGMLGPKYEDLWRECLYRAFPNSSGLRKEVSLAIERVRKFRNRLAHHDSLMNLDVPFEIRHVIETARYISADAALWLEQRNAAMLAYAERPGGTRADTVVVAAPDAWPLYESGCSAYICQPGRSFRAVERIAFYADHEIKPHVPKIIERRDNVEWTDEEAQRLDQGSKIDRKLAEVIRRSRRLDWSGRFQVFLLTRAGNPDHRMLPAPLRHEDKSAFTRRQRYVALHSLETATTTASLIGDDQELGVAARGLHGADLA